ncbi:NAD(P)-binding domain-containing protein [Micromonospora sp. H33]|uniref:NAD(P)-binding domain-containing protein n=1 Tax=Micromonospora sp. H33 TaxID=3452215 RepID=UPI003F8BFAF0
MAKVKQSVPRVAVIGTGAVGSAVARRLLASGYEVSVWNRTESRAKELLVEGALPARSVWEAVSASTLVFLTLKDYQAVEQCLIQIDVNLSGRTLVGMYTGTPSEARLIAQRVTSRGAQYIDAGVQTSPSLSAPIPRPSCTADPGTRSSNTDPSSRC